MPEPRQAALRWLSPLGYLGLAWWEWGPPEGAPVVAPEAAHMAQQYFDRRKLTIYGGSSEIQRNIIARRILNV